MKTKGLTFQQALEALKENKCVGIRPEKFLGNDYYKKDNSNYLAYFNPLTNTFTFAKPLPIPLLLSKWNLVTEATAIQIEQRIFNYWIVVWSNGIVDFYVQKPLDATYKRAQHVFERCQEYTFTY